MSAWPELRESHTVRTGNPPGLVVRCGLVDTMLADLSVSVVYFFERTLDERQLAHGLAAALGLLPTFAGRLRTRADVLEIVCDDTGVPLTVYDLDQTLAEAMSRVTLPGSGLVDQVDAQGARQGGLPLLTVRVSRLAGGGTALGCSWHHALGDVQTFMLLMRAWSAAVEQLPLPEALLLPDQDAFLDQVLPQQDCGRPGFRLPEPEQAAVLRREFESATRSNRTAQVYFGDQELLRMRDELSVAAGQKLSVGDALCGHVVSTIRQLDDDAEARQLTVPVNVRRPLDLPAAAVGNLLSEIHLPCGPRATAEQIAVDLRAAIEDFPRSHLNLRANLVFLESIGRSRFRDCVPLGFDPVDKRFTFSNWSRFGAYDAVFAGQRAVFFSPTGNLPLPWVSWVVEGFEGTGALFTVVLPARLAARLRTPAARAALHRFRSPADTLPGLAESAPKVL
jgi:Transferase family